MWTSRHRRPPQPAADPAPLVVAEERRRRRAAREASFLEADHEHVLEASRPGPGEVKDGEHGPAPEAPGLEPRPSPARPARPPGDTGAAIAPSPRDIEHPAAAFVRAQVVPRGLADGRLLHAVRVAGGGSWRFSPRPRPGDSAERTASSAGSLASQPSSSSSTRSASSIARPRSLPSTKSTLPRRRPEYGARR